MGRALEPRGRDESLRPSAARGLRGERRRRAKNARSVGSGIRRTRLSSGALGGAGGAARAPPLSNAPGGAPRTPLLARRAYENPPSPKRPDHPRLHALGGEREIRV